MFFDPFKLPQLKGLSLAQKKRIVAQWNRELRSIMPTAVLHGALGLGVGLSVGFARHGYEGFALFLFVVCAICIISIDIRNYRCILRARRKLYEQKAQEWQAQQAAKPADAAENPTK